MYELCRHIMPNNKHCGSPAIKGQLFCFNHQNVKRALAKVAPKPDPYGIYTPLPFAFPEDRAALQLNYMIVLQALNDRSIHLQMANAFNRILRSCEMNLSHGPLTETDPENPAKDIVQRVILTPDGQEIAPPRSAFEEGEGEPVHGENCPCRVCAEDFRAAPPEEHHVDCKCGLCEEITDQQSTITDQQSTITDQQSTITDQQAVITDQQEPIPVPPSAPSVQEKPSPSTNGCHDERSTKSEGEQPVSLKASQDSLPAPRRARRAVTARRFEPTAPIQQSSSIDEAVFSDQIREYEAEQAEIARAARQAGLKPPPHKPWDNTMYKSEAERRYEHHREQIRKNQQAAREAWIKHHPDVPPEEPCLSWGEEHDRKLAAMKEPPGSNPPQFSVPA